MIRRFDLPLLALLVLGGIAALQHWVGPQRPMGAGIRVGAELTVTSAADSGPGSLRQAIFAANRADQRVLIRCLAPTVELLHPLPPLANPRGVVIEAGPAGCSLDGAGLGEAAVVDLDSPGSALRGIEVVAGGGTGILVRAPGAELIAVTVSRGAVGIAAAAGSGGLVVRGCRLAGNGLGVSVDATALPVLVEDCEIRDHREAGLWSVVDRPGPPLEPALTVRRNLFSGNRIGVVIADVAAEVVDNRFEAAGQTAVHLIGGAARVRRNHLSDAGVYGIFAERTAASTLIEGNEIRAAGSVGILLRTARGTTVRDNRLYSSAYGLIDVLGDREQPASLDDNLLTSHRLDGLVILGGAPLVRRNRVLRSRGAGLRILDLIDDEGVRTPARPLLEGNVLEGNGQNRVVTGVYRVEAPAESDP